MTYIIYFVVNLFLFIMSVCLIKEVLGYEIIKNKLIMFLGILVGSAIPMVFYLPSADFSLSTRLLITFAMMLVKAFCFGLVFWRAELKMFYLSLLSFVLSENYTNILNIVTNDPLKIKIIACVAESIVILMLLFYIKQKDLSLLIRSRIKIIPLSLYILILFFLYIMSLFEYTSIMEEYNKIARIMMFPVIVIITYIIVKIIEISAVEKENENVSRLLSIQLENQIEYYQKINAIYAEFRGFRHDFQNHLLCIRSLLKANAIDKALEYMNDIENMSYSKKMSYETGNIIADALLNDKKEKAEAVNAVLTFKGIAPTMGISNADLCTIMANAVDNAIEACAKDLTGTYKEITISSDFRQGYYFFSVRNPIFEEVEIKGKNKVKTSKKDKNFHGFGVANIVKTAEKYNGKAEIHSENGEFILEVELQLNQNL